MSQRKVSLSIGGLQRKYGDEEAIRFAKSIGCDAVDFDRGRAINASRFL